MPKNPKSATEHEPLQPFWNGFKRIPTSSLDHPYPSRYLLTSFEGSLFAQVAQSVEQRIENPRVGGSIPSLGTSLHYNFLKGAIK